MEVFDSHLAYMNAMDKKINMHRYNLSQMMESAAGRVNTFCKEYKRLRKSQDFKVALTMSDLS